MNVSEINAQLRGMGIKTSNSHIKKTAVKLGFGESFDYADIDAQRIIDTVMEGRRVTKQPKEAYQEVTQTVSDSSEIVLASFADSCIQAGREAANEQLQGILQQGLALMKQSYDAQMGAGVPLLRQSLTECVPVFGLPKYSDNELVDWSSLSSLTHPELSLGVAR